MTFIALTHLDGKKYPFNLDLVAWMQPQMAHTRLWFGGCDDDYIPVKETPEQIMALAAAQPK